MALDQHLGRLAGLNPSVRSYAEYTLRVASLYGLRPVVTSGYRSFAKQAELRERFEAGLSKWPAARPGESAHNFGLAWDSWVPDEQMPLWVALREWLGWQVLRGDEIHAQVPDWRSYVIGA